MLCILTTRYHLSRQIVLDEEFLCDIATLNYLGNVLELFQKNNSITLFSTVKTVK